MKTGIFGGTFNPPHRGHAEALRAFIHAARLEKVFVIPTYIPPHKLTPEKWADFHHRLEMCRIAFGKIADSCEIVFSDIEKKIFEETGEKSYTCMTIERLLENGEDTLCLYMGTDMFITLEEWRRPEYLFENAEIWVMPREDGEDLQITEFAKAYEKKYPECQIGIIKESPTPASSTQIRSGNLGLLDREVRKYVQEKGLYR